MPRPKSDKTKRDRSRKPTDLPQKFGSRRDVERVTGLTDGTIRNCEQRGIGPKPIRLEGTKVVLHDLEAWIEYLRRCA